MAQVVKLDPGFEKAVLNSVGVEAVVRSELNRVAAKARSITTSETIAASIEVVIARENGRLIGRVVAKDFKSHWFEFGTVKMKARPYLTPAAMQCGYHLEARRV